MRKDLSNAQTKRPSAVVIGATCVIYGRLIAKMFRNVRGFDAPTLKSGTHARYKRVAVECSVVVVASKFVPIDRLLECC